MFGFGNKAKANPVAEFEAAIKRAISIAQLAGVPRTEMAAVLSSWCVSWNRQALHSREMRQNRTDGLHISGNIE
jgi:hypothetical protein